jgi:hypothetical protein
MNELESTKFLRILLQKNAEQVQSWLKIVWSEQQQVPENFNWLGLAQVSTSRVQELVIKSNEDH